MKQKEVEDVLGGKEEFANADSMDSKSFAVLLYSQQKLISSSMSRGGLRRRTGVLFSVADSQCGRTDDYIPQGGMILLILIYVSC